MHDTRKSSMLKPLPAQPQNSEVDIPQELTLLCDFLQVSNVRESKIFELLRCDESEALILQIMLKNFLDGESSFVVGEFLKKHFDKIPTKNFSLLSNIRNLVELGWLTQDDFEPTENEKSSLLELYNDRVSISSNLFNLIEGNNEQNPPEISAYSNNLDFLKDQFNRIDMLYKSQFSKREQSALKTHLNLLEERIKARLRLTKKTIPIQKFFKDNKLNQKEQTIFLALLKEEWSLKDNDLNRYANSLIGLISNNDYDKIKNATLLSEHSNLLSRGLVDCGEYFSSFGNFEKVFYITPEVLQDLSDIHSARRAAKVNLQSLLKTQDIFELLEPKQDLDDVVLNPHARQTLYNLLAQVDSKVAQRLKLWGIKDNKNIQAKILFYGPAGTGKTLSAMALAKSLKKEVISFDCSKILSMWIGESEKNVRQIFETYKEICKKIKNEPILLLDEADQFLSARGNVASSADKSYNQMQNIFLEQIEQFSGVLIATTNLLENLDSAFSRRFNHKIEFKRPNVAQRIELWKKFLPKNITLECPKDTLIKELSSYDLSGAQIKLVIKNTAYKVAVRDDAIFTLNDFSEEITKEIDTNFDGNKSVGFIKK